MTVKKKTTALNHDDIADGRIVSSRHLVSERCAELSELEYALIMTSNAFNKWMVRCMTAAGEPDMGAFDVSLLHHVNHRNRKKKLADICFVLNVEDTHVVTYALKKLVKAGYVTSEKAGKELFSPLRRRESAVHEVPGGAGGLPDQHSCGKRYSGRVDWRDRAVTPRDLLPV